MADAVRRRVRVHGTVQGIGFRWAARDEAERLGVAGWVRNLPDGSVEAEVEGGSAAVERMLGWLRHGPPGAVVDACRVEDAEADGAPGFRIVR